MQICSRLTEDQSEIEKMIESGYALAQNMSWDVVVKDYLLPGLQKVFSKQHPQNIYTRA